MFFFSFQAVINTHPAFNNIDADLRNILRGSGVYEND